MSSIAHAAYAFAKFAMTACSHKPLLKPMTRHLHVRRWWTPWRGRSIQTRMWTSLKQLLIAAVAPGNVNCRRNTNVPKVVASDRVVVARIDNRRPSITKPAFTEMILREAY